MVLEMINAINPIVRLEALREYMYWRIDNWPFANAFGFEPWLLKYKKKIIPGTPEYCKAIATHCFYCETLFSTEERIATIDHFEPSSKFKTEKFVICCKHCNGRKADKDPDILAADMIRAALRGFYFWGHHGKRLEKMGKKIQQIQNDRLWKMGPAVYYIKK